MCECTNVCVYVSSTYSLVHNACALLLQSIILKMVDIDHMLTLNVAHQTKAQADTEWCRETRK